ncbi:MAG: TraG family conjugative transposon ATPase, partial [Cyclobacteriaceae bacterium]
IKTNEALTRIKQVGFVPKVETVNTMLLYMSNLPGNSAELPQESRVQLFTHQAACLMNYESTYRSDPHGVMFTDRINGQPIRVDLSDLPMEKKWINNRNKFVLGGSGSGKSFLTNGCMRHYAENDADIVILDMGDSYRGLCDFFGGTYLKYTDENPIAFNPFKLPNNERYPVRDKIDALVALLFSLWGKEEEGKVSKEQFRLESLTLGESIEMYYKWINQPENKHLEVKFDTYYEFLGNQFRNHLKQQNFTDEDFNLRTLLLILKHFYQGGQYDFLLNSDIDHTLFEEKFIVFEIDAIKNNDVLYPVVTIIIMEVFISKMLKKKGIRKIMLIEEAWKALSEKKMATFIEYLYRTCRKYYGETWTVTQNPDDILESEFAKKTIVNNADTKLILDLSKFENNLEDIMRMLNFTEHQANQVLSLNPGDELKARIKRNYKEVYVAYLKYSNVYAFEVSPNEYFTYTTEEREKNAVNEIAAINDCSTAQAIERIITQYHGDYKKAYQHEVQNQQNNPVVDTLEKLHETGLDYHQAYTLLKNVYQFNYKRALQEVYIPYQKGIHYQQQAHLA